MDPDDARLNIAKKEYSAANITYLIGCGANISGGDYDIVFMGA